MNLYVHGVDTARAMKKNIARWCAGEKAELRERIKASPPEGFDEAEEKYMTATYKLAYEVQNHLCYDVRGMTMKHRDCVEHDNWKYCIGDEVVKGNIDKWFTPHTLDGICAAAEHDDMLSKDYRVGTFSKPKMIKVGPAADMNDAGIGDGDSQDYCEVYITRRPRTTALTWKPEFKNMNKITWTTYDERFEPDHHEGLGHKHREWTRMKKKGDQRIKSYCKYKEEERPAIVVTLVYDPMQKEANMAELDSDDAATVPMSLQEYDETHFHP